MHQLPLQIAILISRNARQDDQTRPHFLWNLGSLHCLHNLPNNFATCLLINYYAHFNELNYKSGRWVGMTPYSVIPSHSRVFVLGGLLATYLDPKGVRDVI